MLCTLVFAIGTFPYALRAVAIPWSLDQDRSWASCFGEVLWSLPMFQIGRDGNFLSLTFFTSSSRQMKKRSMSTLSSTSSMCGSFRSCGSVLPPCAILMSGEWISQDAWCLCATFCYAWCLRNWCLRQHQPVSTLLQGKYKGIAETCQMTMNYVLLRWARLFFRDERGYSQQRRITISMIKADLIETEKHGRLLKVLGNCAFHFRWYLNRMQFKPEGSYDVSIQMG